MQLLLNCKANMYWLQLKLLNLKALPAMKMTCILLLATSLQMTASGYSQGITLSSKNASLETLFKAVEQQSNYQFVYSKEAMEQSKPVSIEVRNESLENVLKILFVDQPLAYTIDEKFIIIKIADKEKKVFQPPPAIRGKVVNEKGEPVQGASVIAQRSNKGTSTNEAGEFILNEIIDNDILIITSVGYFKEEVPVDRQVYFVVTLKIAIGNLDQAIVMAYGQTTRRLNTGNITKVSSEEIARQPVTNPLAALQGRVPGLVITQTSGIPGSSFNVEIRGRSSLDMNLSRNDPLFIIDGVPFEPGNLASNQIVSAANKPMSTNLGGLSPLNTVNPMDIESIEVLKDADATAIYGSRGANGVILITTKKGKVGKTRVDVNFNTGWSKVTRTMDLLNTPEYLAMRREAFANDGFTPQVSVPFTNGYAPDLLILDTTIYTDFKKILIGGTARSTNAELSVSGGSDNTFFLLGTAFHNETTVFSDDLTDRRASVHFSVNHKSLNKKFEIIYSGFYSNEKNKLLQTDLTSFINLPPHYVLYDSAGRPAWTQKGIPINYIFSGVLGMPSAEFLKEYTSINENLLGSVQLSYKLFKGTTLRLNSGYNKFTSDEFSTIPKSSIDPLSSALASSKFGNGLSSSWNVDPQLEFSKVIRKLQVNFLIGSSFQERTTKSTYISANNYTSDLLLNSIAAAGQLIVTNSYAQYRYTAFFGRLNLNLENKYILTISARRDGSSRFGPEERFSNFGAVGAGWLFSNESFIKNKVRFLSYGKFRFSYGTTGNDQIGNYKYLDLWSSTATPYQGTPGLQPTTLFNPGYEWEENKKGEAALELGFLKDRILFSFSYYRHRSRNQLINYQLPSQTGFSSITKNLGALVENSGIELVLTTRNVSTNKFSWTSSLNLTIPKNKLISFPGLASSSYYTSFQEGKSLNVLNRARYLGVDPASGIYIVEDYNKDGVISLPADRQFMGNTDPEFYGGFQNNLDYGNFSFSFFFDVRKQIGRNYLNYINGYSPGVAYNQPVVVLNRWQKSGDISTIQRFTTKFFGTPAATGAGYLSNSDGIFSDASFIRLKNVALSYNLPASVLKKMKIESSQIYLQAQNLFVITNYEGSDPETQDIYVLPPLRTIVAGIRLTF
jgi:TonB-dependent starch-binding outer membrane protein SusC